MIFYFTGSGNSYSVAKQIGDKIGENLVPLALFNDFESCRNCKYIGIVFPCYIGQAPDIVLDFKEKLFRYVDKDHTFIFCVITYANSPANSYNAFKRSIHAWFEVKMPENDIANSHAPSKEKEELLLSNAKIKIDGFIEDILAKKEVTVGSRPVLGAILKLVSKSMKKMYANFDTYLSADANCSKCKMCIQYCPLKNITFDNTPVWGGNCANCFGCVNRCPKQAIQYKKKTVGKLRYVHPDYMKIYY